MNAGGSEKRLVARLREAGRSPAWAGGFVGPMRFLNADGSGQLNLSEPALERPRARLVAPQKKERATDEVSAADRGR